MSELDAILGPSRPPRRRGCPLCQEATKAAIDLRIRGLSGDGKPRPGSRGIAISFCETHAIAIWTKLSGELEATRNGGAS